MSVNKYFIAVVLGLLLSTVRLYADGCFVWNEGADLHEPVQRAIIYFEDGREVLLLQVKYEGPAEDFAWIVPLPCRPEVTAIDADKSPFAEMSIYTQWRRGWGYRRREKAEPGMQDQVTVLERKTVGVYDIAVLAASKAGALNTWLNANGYAFPQNRNDVLAHYTGKKWVYVAMRIDRDALESSEVKKLKTGRLQPIRFSFETKEMVYPLKISSVNAGETEVLLYLLANAPMVVKGEHNKTGLSIEYNICRFPRYQDQAYGTFRNATGVELPLTWQALGLGNDTELSLCKYRALYRTEEMTDDLTFERFEPIRYWKGQLVKGKKENNNWLKLPALSVLGYYDAELLRKLATDKDTDLRKIAACNPATPTKLLLALARDKSERVRQELAYNSGAPLEVLAILTKDKNWYVRREVARYAKVPQVLAILAEDSDANVRQALAWNPNVPTDLLCRLAEDNSAMVRAAAAWHPRIPLKVLLQLAQDKHEDVRAKAASNKKLPTEVLKRLAWDDSSYVRYFVLLNENLPEELLQQLATDKDPEVRVRVASHSRISQHLLGLLAHDKNAQVRRVVATNPNTPKDTLQTLAQDTDSYVAEQAKSALEKQGN